MHNLSAHTALPKLMIGRVGSDQRRSSTNAKAAVATEPAGMMVIYGGGEEDPSDDGLHVQDWDDASDWQSYMFKRTESNNDF
jgi:hypothetical protein